MAEIVDVNRFGLCFNGGPCEGGDENSGVTEDWKILN
jgi:hypothetical protein